MAPALRMTRSIIEKLKFFFVFFLVRIENTRERRVDRSKLTITHIDIFLL